MTRIDRLREVTLQRTKDVHLDRARLVTESYKATEGEAIALRRAKAIAHFIENAPIAIFDEELIVGDRSWVQPYHFNYPDQNPKNRPQSPDPAIDHALKEMWSYWLDPRIFPPTSTPVKGHCVPGFAKLLAVGFDGIAAKAERVLSALQESDPEFASKRAFLQAETLLAKSCGAIGRRFAALARQMAKSAPARRKAELSKIAEVCDRVPAQPPRNFREAVQALWFGELLAECEDSPNAHSPGRIDQILYPFYERDRAEGRLTKRQAQELLCCAWLKLWAPYDVHDTMIGGLKPDGSDATNELSYMILDVQSRVGLHRQLSVRYHSRLPKRFVRKMCDVIHEGLGVPQLFNDDVLVPALMDLGLPAEAARSYSIIGCIEMTVPGEADMRAVAHYSNLPKCLEYALTNGVCLTTGKQAGLPTGDVSEIATYDDLFLRYSLQVAEEVRKAVAWQFQVEPRETATFPMPLYSLLTEECIARGKDITAGGARYNSSMYCAVGIPNVADSLAAIKKLVFEERRVSLEELVAAMRQNFSGKESLRQLLLRAPKYGNDDDYVDRLALDVATQYCEECKNHRDPRGGRIAPSYFSFTLCVSMGKQTGASPDGRLAGTPLANSLVHAEGHGAEGPTALLKSAAKLNQRQATGGTSMLLDLHPSMVKKANGADPIEVLLRTYFSLGGSHIEVTIADAKRLRAAQKEPDKYRHLTVRVAGYSAHFVNLSRELQEHIIARTERK
jgi:formate C-acetyltransferase